MSKYTEATYTKLIETENKIDTWLSSENAKHIQVQLLHKYNNIKDATQIVINHIANMEGRSVSEIHKHSGRLK